MKSNSTLGRVALSLFALLSCASAQNRTFTNQYSFGDSLSDSGNLFAATSALGAGTPGAPYFQGRVSNGRVFTELLGTNMALVATSPASVKSSLNFAFAGATAGGAGTLPPSMGVQIGLYQARAITPSKTDLFTVFFGANDLISVLSAPTTALNPANLDVAGAATAATVAGGVQSLVGLGAKNIVVAGLPNLGGTARSVALGSTAQAFGLRASSAFNAELQSRLGAIAASAPAADVNLVYIDVQGLLDRVILDFRALGFSNATSFAIAPASAGGGGDPNGYVFFDDIHPSAKTHALLAGAVVEALNPEPVLGFAATQGTAALALQSISVAALDTRIAQVAGKNRPKGRTDLYAAFNYGDGNRSAEGWRRKFNYMAQVVTAGGDVRLGENFVAGASLNSGKLEAEISGAGGKYAVGDLTGRAYGIWRGGPVSLLMDVAYGALDLKGINRTTGFAGYRTAGKTGGEHWGAGVKAIWTLDPMANVSIRPWLGLRTERVKLEGYTEKDVPVVMMDFAAQKAKSSVGSVGADFSKDMKIADCAVRFDFRAAWHGEMGSEDRAVTGRLAGNVTRPTSVRVKNGDGSAFELGGAATIAVIKNWSASLGYAGDIRSGDKLASRFSLSLQTGF